MSINGLVPMTPFYTPNPVRQGAEAIFGTKEEQLKALEDTNERITSAAWSTRVNGGGPQYLFNGPVPVIGGGVNVVDTFQFNVPGNALSWPNSQLLGPNRPSMIEFAKQQAANARKEQDLLWKLNTVINSNAVIGVALLAAAYYLLKHNTKT